MRRIRIWWRRQGADDRYGIVMGFVSVALIVVIFGVAHLIVVGAP
jgi:hypothetical protein